MYASSSTPLNALRDPNRFITDTSTDGKAVFSSTLPDSLPVVKNLNGALFRLGYITDRPPVSLKPGDNYNINNDNDNDSDNDNDIKTYAKYLENPPGLIVTGGGAVVWYIDTPPDSASPLHRTVSLDLVVQLEGEVELLLDSGETRLLKPGDLTIQRATMHAWRNPSKTQWSRMLGVMSECKPVEIGGKKLGAEFPPIGES